MIGVRQNKGGANRPIFEWVAALSSDALPTGGMQMVGSDLTLQADVIGARCRLERAKSAAPEKRERLETNLREADAALAKARDEHQKPFRNLGVYPPGERADGQAPDAFQGAVVVLGDSLSASSGETMHSVTRALIGAVHVGENTAGLQEFGDVKSYRLPNSRIMLILGNKWFTRAEPALTVVEGRGYPSVSNERLGTRLADAMECLDNGFAAATHVLRVSKSAAEGAVAVSFYRAGWMRTSFTTG